MTELIRYPCPDGEDCRGDMDTYGARPNNHTGFCWLRQACRLVSLVPWCDPDGERTEPGVGMPFDYNHIERACVECGEGGPADQFEPICNSCHTFLQNDIKALSKELSDE